MLWGFGDSWGEGCGLAPNETPYTQILADKLNLDCTNLATGGNSLGEITDKFIKHSNNFKPNDIVLITIPPDTRWHVPSSAHSTEIHSLFSQEPKYDSFLRLIKGNIYWFHWHHSIFLNFIYHHARHKKVTLFMQHNYGKVTLIPELEYISEDFIDFKTSMTGWLTGNDMYDYHLDKPNHCGLDCQKVLYNKFFFEGDSHPNQLGHNEIATRLYESVIERL